MKNKVYERSVTFRDNNMNRWTVEFEVCEIGPYTRRNVDTLEEFEEHLEVSVCGEGGDSCGQCYGRIVPRTTGQKELIDFWNKYHCCGMHSGTKAQEKYLHGEQYKKDFEEFVKLFSGYDDNLRQQFDSTSFNIMCKFYDVLPEYMPALRNVIEKYVNGNPIKYILGLLPNRLNHDNHDLYVKYIFLAIRGLYINMGYKYGTDWLYLPVPENVCEKIDFLCEALQNEEDELSQELAVPGDFDMGAEGFEITESVIENVMEMRECDEKEAKRFIALGVHLELTFSDLNDTFEESDNCLYKANGTEYYVGTEDELTEIAKDIVDDDEYEYFWREAVAAESTILGLEEWRESIIEIDGWCNILNSWDGRYESYNVAGECICVSRT